LLCCLPAPACAQPSLSPIKPTGLKVNDLGARDGLIYFLDQDGHLIIGQHQLGGSFDHYNWFALSDVVLQGQDRWDLGVVYSQTTGAPDRLLIAYADQTVENQIQLIETDLARLGTAPRTWTQSGMKEGQRITALACVQGLTIPRIVFSEAGMAADPALQYLVGDLILLADAHEPAEAQEVKPRFLGYVYSSVSNLQATAVRDGLAISVLYGAPSFRPAQLGLPPTATLEFLHCNADGTEARQCRLYSEPYLSDPVLMSCDYISLLCQPSQFGVLEFSDWSLYASGNPRLKTLVPDHRRFVKACAALTADGEYYDFAVARKPSYLSLCETGLDPVVYRSRTGVTFSDVSCQCGGTPFRVKDFALLSIQDEPWLLLAQRQGDDCDSLFLLSATQNNGPSYRLF